MRSPHHYNFPGQRGATLIEILVVIIIIAVVASLALMQRGTANAQFQRQNISRQLKVAFERARFDSVKRRADTSGTQANVAVTGSTFTLTVNGLATTTDFGAQNIVIANSGGTTLATTYVVYFNQRGEAVDNTGAYITPELLVCNGTCPNPLTNDKSDRLLVTRTGTVNLLAGPAAPPSFNAPPVTDVPNTNGIKQFVTVP
jgi:prepilin-type N-terminal cleavage/methylation domain-containing protein